MKITHEEAQQIINRWLETWFPTTFKSVKKNNKSVITMNDYIAQQQEFEVKVKRYFELEEIIENNGKSYCDASDLAEFYLLKTELQIHVGFNSKEKKK
jgi:hypothetical protein